MTVTLHQRLNYIRRSLTAEGKRTILQGIPLWRARVHKRNHWLETSDMEPRTRDVLSCPDLESIPTVPRAGQLQDGVQTNTYSFDGLIAARRSELQGCPAVPIATR